MNREFYTRKALQESVNEAKRTRSPLSVWPQDAHQITLEQLPVVVEAFPSRRFAVKNTAELRVEITTGKRYGLLGLLPTAEGKLIVGEWE